MSMSFDSYIETVKEITSPPEDFFYDRLVRAVQQANDGVHGTFFSTQDDSEPYLTTDLDQHSSALKQFSVLYVCFVLSTQTVNGFNKTVQNCSASVVLNWFKATEAVSLGKALFLDYAKLSSVLGDFFDNAASSASMISEQASTPEFVNGFLTQCDEIGSILPVKALLVTLEALDDGGSNYKSVLEAFQASERWDNGLSDFDTYPWISGQGPMFDQDGAAYNSIKAPVVRACKVDTKENFQTFQRIGMQMRPVQWLRIIYGKAVEEWLDTSSGPKKYGYRTSSAPENVTVTKLG